MMRWMGVMLLAGAGLIAVFLSGVLSPFSYTFHGSTMNPAFTAPDFQLVDTQGRHFRLSEQRGSVVLLYFGYTHCPDECPLAMATYRQVLENLGKQANEVRFTFITVDPAHDTPQVIGDYLSRFTPEIIGLTGTDAQLKTAWQAFGVYQQDATSGHGIDHSDMIFLIDPQGKVRVTYPNNIPANDLLSDVRQVLKGG